MHILLNFIIRTIVILLEKKFILNREVLFHFNKYLGWTKTLLPIDFDKFF